MNLDSLAQELDRLYQFEISEYISRCSELKRSGYKIYRNSKGEHKVALGGQQSSTAYQEQYVNDKAAPKKENIFVRAKNRVKRGVQNFRSFVGFIKYMYKLYKKGGI
jgi:hypothetical protein